MPQAQMPLPPVLNSFCWFDLNTRDVERVKKFYNTVFGWKTSPENIGDGVYHHLHDHEGTMFGGLVDQGECPGQENVPSHWISYILVDDVDRKAARATELGGTVIMPPTDIPDVGRFAGAADNDGRRDGTAITTFEGDAPETTSARGNETGYPARECVEPAESAHRGRRTDPPNAPVQRWRPAPAAALMEWTPPDD